MNGEVPGTIYGMSEWGWTNQELFLFWLKPFLNYANPGRPLLLLLDGHSSQFELGTIELAKEKDLICCLHMDFIELTLKLPITLVL